MSKPVSLLLVLCLVMMDGCTQRVLKQLAQANVQEVHTSTQMLAVYMPWFGDHNHIDVGYSSHDPATLRQQIESARAMGISAFVVDWYGDRRPFLDTTFKLLQHAAKETNFKVALMYDETEDDNGNATDETIAALTKAYQAYIGPQAPDRGAYLTHNGQPVIVIFPKQGHTDWNAVRERVSHWERPPLLFYKDAPPQQFESAFDGYYPWIHPGGKNWSPDGSDWGEQYLESFYQNMKKKYPGKLAMGAAWPGFDDSRAPWSLNRHMNSRCGKTLEETLKLYHRYYDNSSPLPFLLVETWNDYEEGTAVERHGDANCSEGASGG